MSKKELPRLAWWKAASTWGTVGAVGSALVAAFAEPEVQSAVGTALEDGTVTLSEGLMVLAALLMVFVWRERSNPRRRIGLKDDPEDEA